MLKEIIRWRPFSMSRSQAEYIWLILLASLVGVLAAFGNLMLREAIRFFMWVFQVVEWNILQIPRGIPFSLLVPVVLVSGGLFIILLEVLLPGDIMGYGFPSFLEKIHLGDARLRTLGFLPKRSARRCRWARARLLAVKARSPRLAAPLGPWLHAWRVCQPSAPRSWWLAEPERESRRPSMRRSADSCSPRRLSCWVRPNWAIFPCW